MKKFKKALNSINAIGRLWMIDEIFSQRKFFIHISKINEGHMKKTWLGVSGGTVIGCFLLFLGLLRSCGTFPYSEDYSGTTANKEMIGQLKRGQYIPWQAEDIHYVYHHDLLNCSLLWSCRVKIQDFLDFAQRNHWSVCRQFMPEGALPWGGEISPPTWRNTFIFATGNGLMIDSDEHHVKISVNRSEQGLQVIYDPEAEMMFGRYWSR